VDSYFHIIGTTVIRKSFLVIPADIGRNIGTTVILTSMTMILKSYTFIYKLKFYNNGMEIFIGDFFEWGVVMGCIYKKN